MKKLLLSNQREKVSFLHDPEALGLLLHEIVEIADRSRGEVHINNLEYSARDLGYQGSLAGLRRVLIGRGFITEVEKYKRFYLQELNREAIQLFFSKHRLLFSRKVLSEADRSFLYADSCVGGTEAERMLLRVMKSLTTMLGEMERIPLIESRLLACLAMSEFSYFVAFDRVRWLHKKLGRLEAESLVSRMGGTVESQQRWYTFNVQLSEIRRELILAIDDSLRQRGEMLQAIDDCEVLRLLKLVREATVKFGGIMVTKEAGLSK